MIAMFTSVSVFGEWAAETEAAGNGTGAGLRAKLARSIGCYEIFPKTEVEDARYLRPKNKVIIL